MVSDPGQPMWTSVPSATLHDLKSQLANAKAWIDQLSSENAKLQAQSQAADLLIQTMEEANAKLLEVQQRLTERVAELEGENRTWEAGYKDLTADNARLKQRIAELERGEFICHKCGLRKDGEQADAGF